MNDELQLQFFHDITRKKLFASKEITRSFIAGIAELENIEKNIVDIIPIPTQHFDSKYKKSENDCIWKITLNNDDVVYLYLMLEFQSSIDKKMSYRILRYVMDLTDKIVAENNLKKGNYPNIIPIVLYNGDISWNAATNIRDLYQKNNPFPNTYSEYGICFD